MGQNKELTVKLINEDGKNYESIKVKFDRSRLRRKVAKQLKTKVDITNFAEFDDSGAIDPSNIKFKKVDFKAMMEAQEEVNEDLVWLLWGFPSDKVKDDVSEDDYLTMLDEVKKADPLGLEAAKKDAKKNMEKEKN